MRALLVDQGRDRASLVAVRALTAAGFEVGTAAPGPSFAGLSRHARRHHLVRECGEDEDGFIADVAGAVREGGYDIVLCSYETGLLALSRRREEIAPAVWPYPGYEVVRRTFDKLDLFGAATAAGVPSPYTVAADEDALRAWSGPVVVKARNHVPHRYETAVFEGPEQARALVEQTIAEGGEPLLQTPLRGTMGAVVIVVGRDGRIIAELHQEAKRTWPPGAGDTVLGRIVPVDPELSAAVARLAAELGWIGLAQVELFRDAHGKPWITDFNGRFYGSMALAVRAGVNVPAIWARDALGIDPWEGAAPGEARLGARFQWLNRDLAAGWAQGPASLLDALAAAPVAAHSMWTPSDPMPVFRYLLPEGARRLRERLGGGTTDAAEGGANEAAPAGARDTGGAAPG
jgi:predicted ATP-grasp superfamily ATP-dependent carboligase